MDCNSSMYDMYIYSIRIWGMLMIGVYKIVNTITGDYYIGSSKNIKRRWVTHRCQSVWSREHKQLYVDMQKYGVDNFIMEVIEELPDADIKMLHNREQYYIEQLHPVYNTFAAYTGLDKKQYQKQYRNQHADELKQRKKQYYSQHADDKKQYNQQYYSQHTVEAKQYYSQQCNYNGEILTLGALGMRFKRRGIEHPTAEAKKYLIG